MKPAPLIAVVGPTAGGKSALALRLAQTCRGAIVNFDSIQLYRGFDIGAAKPSAAERAAAPHHLLDVLDPSERTTAGDYARRARPVLAEIAARGNLPVLTGGTGFYLRALLDGLFPGARRDDALRQRLQAMAHRRGPGALHRLLRRLDPARAEEVHPNDEPKVVRALEVCLLERRPMSSAFEQGGEALDSFEVLRLGLDPPREALYERIDRRTRAMFEGGLLEEVRALLAGGVAREAWPLSAIGYRQALAVVEGRLGTEDAIAETARATRNYAKRQLTWFRRQEPETRWMGGFGDDPPVERQALALAEAFLSRGRS